MDDATCEICGEGFTPHRRKRIECNFCHKSACLQCSQTYLTTGTHDPQCMHCKAAWNREFIDDHFPFSFRDRELKRHRERLLFDRERSLLPETMAAVEREIRYRNRHEEARRLDRHIYDLALALAQARMRRNEIRLGHFGAERGETGARTVLCPCPAGECRGYISKGDEQCGICRQRVCGKCLEPLAEGQEHECTPDALASAKAILKETKPCPGCHAPIFRTEGCSQMWCTKCNTAFDWVSGRVVQGRVHNPHYFEWVRRGGGEVRAPHDLLCGGLPSAERLYSRIQHLYTKRSAADPVAHADRVYWALRVLLDMEQVELPSRRLAAAVNPARNESIRVRYLLKELTDEQMAAELQRVEKRRERDRAILDVQEMFYAVGRELIARVMDAPAIDLPFLREIHTQLEELRSYYNTEIERVSRRFKSALCPRILEGFHGIEGRR